MLATVIMLAKVSLANRNLTFPNTRGRAGCRQGNRRRLQSRSGCAALRKRRQARLPRRTGGSL